MATTPVSIGDIQDKLYLNRVVVSNSTYDASVNDEIFADSRANSIIITLPTELEQFDTVVIVDCYGTFKTNNVVLNPGTEKIMGTEDTLVLDVDNIRVELMYLDATRGWIYQ